MKYFVLSVKNIQYIQLLFQKSEQLGRKPKSIEQQGTKKGRPVKTTKRLSGKAKVWGKLTSLRVT